MSNNLNILVVGAGLIAREYIKVLLALGHSPQVIGRGSAKVDELAVEFPDIEATAGGLESWLEKNTAPSHAIVATPIENLAKATKLLLNEGCQSILVEKPLTYLTTEALDVYQLAESRNAQVFIAFNRRSYVSVKEAIRLIESDGGVSSFHFDFTEAIFRIDPTSYNPETRLRWGVANSSHVIDTAFFLGGSPEWIESRQYGKAVDWHPAGSIFTGVGETIQGVPFTYHSNWGCPGRWNIEIITPERKMLFSPMERLHQQLKGSFKVELVDLDYSKDIDFKPGFYNQVQDWLNGREQLFNIQSLEKELGLLNRIFNY